MGEATVSGCEMLDSKVKLFIGRASEVLLPHPVEGFCPIFCVEIGGWASAIESVEKECVRFLNHGVHRFAAAVVGNNSVINDEPEGNKLPDKVVIEYWEEFPIGIKDIVKGADAEIKAAFGRRGAHHLASILKGADSPFARLAFIKRVERVMARTGWINAKHIKIVVSTEAESRKLLDILCGVMEMGLLGAKQNALSPAELVIVVRTTIGIDEVVLLVQAF